MIHWRETDTGYVVSVSRRGSAAMWGVIGALPAYLMYEIGRSLAPGLVDLVPFAPWVLIGIGLTTYLGCLAKAATLWPRTAWVEVALKGGQARWGGRGGTPMPEFIHVDRFESTDLLGPWAHHIVAALPDGRRIAVLPSWTAPPHKARGVAERLNELLGTDPRGLHGEA